MNELLLQQLYGNDDVETVKQAQAELVQQVALEAGIDINALSDEDLAKFAHYVLTDGEVPGTPAAADVSENEKVAMDKLAEADQMGRLMARAYLDEQMKIASAMETGNWTGLEDVAEAILANEVQTKVASATNAIAEGWAQVKEAGAADLANKAITTVKNVAGKLPGVEQASGGFAARNTAKAQLAGMSEKAMKRAPGDVAALKSQVGQANKNIAIGAAKTVGTLAVPVAAGAALAGAGSKKQASLEKEAALQFVENLEPVEFAKLAEARAAEILAANGIHPETFEQIEPTAIKIAEFPTPEDCQSWESKLAMKSYNDLLNDSALTILQSLGFAE